MTGHGMHQVRRNIRIFVAMATIFCAMAFVPSTANATITSSYTGLAFLSGSFNAYNTPTYIQKSSTFRTWGVHCFAVGHIWGPVSNRPGYSWWYGYNSVHNGSYWHHVSRAWLFSTTSTMPFGLHTPGCPPGGR